jgi:hypothetical protein
MTSIDLLRSIANSATGKTIPKPVNIEDVAGEQEIAKSEEFLASSKGLDKRTVFTQWLKSVQDWEFSLNNVEYYWETYDNLYPMGKDKSRESLRKEVEENLNETYWRNKAHTWPRWLQDETEDRVFNLLAAGTGRDVEKSRILNKEFTYDTLQQLDFDNLSTEVALESHVDGVVKALGEGYTEKNLRLNPDGIPSVSMDGVYVSTNNLPTAGMSTDEEAFIFRRDTRSMIRDILSPIYQRNQQRAKESDKETLMTLYNRLGSPTVPDEMNSSIIVQWAQANDNDVNVIYNGIDKVMEHKNFTDIGEASNYMNSLLTDVHNITAKRSTI